MKTRLIFVMALIMMGTISCEKIGVGSWDVQENTFSETTFPKEGSTFTFISGSDSKMNAVLCFAIGTNSTSWGELTKSKINFYLTDIPYEVNGKRLRIYADKLPGRVSYIEEYYGMGKAYVVTLTGNYSFDSKLTRTSYTNRSAFSPTDRLSGKWTIRFESDSGEKLLFEVMDPNLRAPDL